MRKNSGYISSNSSEYGSEPFPNLSSDPDEGNGTWKNVNESIRGGLRTRRTRTRRTRRTRTRRTRRTRTRRTRKSRKSRR